MIISHEHKFIFLKTRKTAGTSVELALRQLCGPDDIIAPIGIAEERRQQSLHYQGRPPQNWRVHGWWQSPRPLFKRYWFRFNPGDYGFYNHIPAKQARALLNDDKAWHSYFKFAFDRNPWDRPIIFATATPSPRHPSRATCGGDGAPGSTITRSIRSTARPVLTSSAGSKASIPICARRCNRRESASIRSSPRAKTNFRGNEKRYRDYYDDETRKIVADWYAPEIGLLHYEF
jgi:hypothetical protein